MLIGNKEVIAFQVGKAASGGPDLLPVQLWLGGIDITAKDPDAYLPAFVAALERDLASLSTPSQREHKKVRSPGDARKHLFLHLSARANRYRVLALGDTTDDLLAFGFAADAMTYIAFTVRPSSRRRCVALPTPELRSIIEQTIAMARSA
ncbi:MAG: hypothetical protein ACOY4U_11110 [Pseudomonadota bacterium]